MLDDGHEQAPATTTNGIQHSHAALEGRCLTFLDARCEMNSLVRPGEHGHDSRQPYKCFGQMWLRILGCNSHTSVLLAAC